MGGIKTKASLGRNVLFATLLKKRLWHKCFPVNFAKFSETPQLLLKKTFPLNDLILAWRRSLSYKNQSIDLLSKSLDWFLYNRDLRHEKVKGAMKLYFMHCSCVVIILLITDLYKSAFSTYSFKKPVLFFCVVSFFSFVLNSKSAHYIYRHQVFCVLFSPMVNMKT